MMYWNQQLLLVEADPVVRDSLKNALEREGFGVSAIAGGRDAFHRFAAGCFDIVVLDLAGLRLGEWDLLRSMKELNPKAKIIVLTVMREVIGAALARGASVALEKPVAIPTLIEAVSESMAEVISERTEANELVAGLA